MRRNMILVAAAILSGVLYLAHDSATQIAPAVRTVAALPTPTVTDDMGAHTGTQLPPCEDEDGWGMALCTFDGIISGDCAPEYVGSEAISQQCVNLFSRPSQEIDNGDGSSHTEPNGADLVGECVEINNTISDDMAKQEGWNIGECIKAYFE